MQWKRNVKNFISVKTIILWKEKALTPLSYGDQFVLVLAITLFFTALAISRRSIITSIISSIAWFWTGSYSPLFIPFTAAFAYFCTAMGILFAILCLSEVFSLYREKTRKWWQRIG